LNLGASSPILIKLISSDMILHKINESKIVSLCRIEILIIKVHKVWVKKFVTSVDEEHETM